jgi:uncharacterized RDD family membrane protein YckC
MGQLALPTEDPTPPRTRDLAAGLWIVIIVLAGLMGAVVIAALVWVFALSGR